MSPQKHRINVLDTDFDNLTMDEAVLALREQMGKKSGAYLVTPNPEIVWLARKDTDFAAVVEQAALVLPDGVGITIGAKILGTPLKARLPGIAVIEQLLATMAPKGESVFLFGAAPGVAQYAAECLVEKYPGLVIAGIADGYSDYDKTAEAICAAEPDLLLVCLGAPRQENWMAAQDFQGVVGVMAGLGGALDVFSGKVRRAPRWMQKAGLEWLYRLIREPRRIGRMMRLPLFLVAVLWRRVTGR